jgi:hypothetical protein
VDTCCINKANNTEFSEAINSMFRWYQNAAKCYVYLSDVPRAAFDANDELNQLPRELDFWESRWFTRGWTLQELLAPDSVEFFSRKGKRLGDKRTLERQIHEITRIALSALQGTPLSQFGVDERLAWAKNRETTRKEDEAYSLLGIFNVYMLVLQAWPLGSLLGQGVFLAIRLGKGVDRLDVKVSETCTGWNKRYD